MEFQSRKLYRYPDEGMFRGVCAGIANYFDVPVWLIRVITVVATFTGFFWLTITMYILFGMILPVVPQGNHRDAGGQSAADLLEQVEYSQARSEKRIRDIERYVTSERFTLNRRFRDL
ncbi:MAG TPA: envelope stress response membrane protein PspC [Morganella sp. (in: Bacteria)]|nr:envelope stress response membrane protein PspC [Morganella sp. (in: enterobacteria)]